MRGHPPAASVPLRYWIPRRQESAARAVLRSDHRRHGHGRCVLGCRARVRVGPAGGAGAFPRPMPVFRPPSLYSNVFGFHRVGGRIAERRRDVHQAGLRVERHRRPLCAPSARGRSLPDRCRRRRAVSPLLSGFTATIEQTFRPWSAVARTEVDQVGLRVVQAISPIASVGKPVKGVVAVEQRMRNSVPVCGQCEQTRSGQRYPRGKTHVPAVDSGGQQIQRTYKALHAVDFIGLINGGVPGTSFGTGCSRLR